MGDEVGTVEIELRYNKIGNDGDVDRNEHESVGKTGTGDSGDIKAVGGNSSIPLAVFNFTNSIVGAGLIGIPYVRYR